MIPKLDKRGGIALYKLDKNRRPLWIHFFFNDGSKKLNIQVLGLLVTIQI